MPFEDTLRRADRLVLARFPSLRGARDRAKDIYHLAQRRLNGRSQLGVSAAFDCLHCRSLDTSSELDRVTAGIVAEAADQGIEVWSLPSYRNSRLAYDSDVPSGHVTALIDALEARNLEVRTRHFDVNANKYEFTEGADEAVPAEGVEHRVSPRPHCGVGKRYLRSRYVSLEAVQVGEATVTIPRGGLGPRLYDRDQFDRFAVSPGRALFHDSYEWPFPIDVVYTWVDADDPAWRAERDAARADVTSHPRSSMNAARWHSRDELRYSLRSIHMYAPFVRRIHVLTNGQVPDWLIEDERVRVVSHRDVFPDDAKLPTFSSRPIESVVHRIPGLAQHFIYLNDDFFLGRPIHPGDLFTIGGSCAVYLSPRHLDDRAPSREDRATVIANKNTRAALQKYCGIRPNQKLKHAPYVMRRDVWERIDEVFTEELHATRQHPFRSWGDISPASFLFAHFALHEGSGYEADIRYGYIDVGNPGLHQALRAFCRKQLQFFCVNDSDADTEEVAAHDDVTATFFRQRFPVRAPWERSTTPSAQSDAGRRRRTSVDILERMTIHDLFALHGHDAVERLIEAEAKARTPAITMMLAEALARVGREPEALETLTSRLPIDDRTTALKLELAARTHVPFAEVLAITPTDARWFIKHLSDLARCVQLPADADAFTALVEQRSSGWRDSTRLLRRVAAARRRAGELGAAIELYERAIHRTPIANHQRPSRRREADALRDPWAVLAHLLEAADRAQADVFLDAGTLLGMARDGTFIPHDYDLDLSVRDPDALRRFSNELSTDWRFDLAPVHRPDLVTQATHINGTNVDVFLHSRENDTWVKRSHVYGWRFTNYDLEPRRFHDLTMLIPTPPERYLQEMYGSTWNVPQSGFDSRVDAPNHFFPDREQIICTLANKALTAALSGRVDFITQARMILARPTIDYTLPRFHREPQTSSSYV